MDNRQQAERLLRALSEADDRYIEEALSPARKAAVTPLRKYSGLIAAIAAALIFLIGGGVLFKLSNTGRNNSARPEADSEETFAEAMYIDAASDELSIRSAATEANDMTYGGECDEATAEETVAECIDGVVGETPVANAVIEAGSAEELYAMSGIGADFPDSVNGSVSTRYYYYPFGMIEVQYLDKHDNLLCTIRKAPASEVQADIPGDYADYVMYEQPDIDGLQNVMIAGADDRFFMATWNCETQDETYAYSVWYESSVSRDDIVDVIMQTS